MGVLAVTGLLLGAITAERRSATAQFAAAEHRFQVLAETVPQMVWTADATGWIDWYNHRWYEYTGQTHEDSVGWGWQRASHPEDVPRVMRDWPRSIATGVPFDIEFRIRRDDGVFRWFLTRAEPLRNASGSIIRWYGTHTDIDDQKRALEQTTRIAETLQAAFLPEQLPERPDLRFDAVYLTAGHQALIGGDWYDAFELPEGHIVVSIGDVAGHGLRAAVTAGRIRQAIFAAAFDAPDPAAILSKVDRIFQAQDRTVATALVAIIDSDLQAMRYASAGHPPPMIASPTKPAQVLPYGGLPLGIADALQVENRAVPLERDAVVLFYTDGITEFGRDINRAEKKLLSALTRLVGNATMPHPAVALQREVVGFERPADDDTALLVLQLSPVAASDQQPDATDLRKTWSFHSSDAYSAQASRHELMGFIHGLAASEEELFRTELILGEVLANTVEHAPGLVNIEIDWTSEYPVISILDTGPGLTRIGVELPNDDLVENGRGLFLIATLAIDVRVEPAPGSGTKMTVTLPVRREQRVHVQI